MDYHRDNQFNIKTLETSLVPELLHIYAKNEHVGIIERSICTIKECERATCHAVIFDRCKTVIVVSPIEDVVDFLKHFPSKDGFSDTLSQSKIVEVRTKVDMGQKKMAFGSYVIVRSSTTNTIRSICVPSISLKSSNNSAGYFLMNIFTKKLMHSYNCK